MSEKTCSFCKERKPIEAFGKWAQGKDGLNHRCRECHNEQNRKAWAAIGATKRREKYHTDAEYRAKVLESVKKVPSAQPEYVKIHKKERLQFLRYEAFKVIGLFCFCCNESRIEFLSFDHLNGGGRQHRLAVGDSEKLYRQILTSPDIQEILRTSCHNCNMSRGFYGYCPHEREVI